MSVVAGLLPRQRRQYHRSDFNRNFNPWWGIPPTVTDENGMVQPYPTRADRGFTPPVPITVFEDFTGQTGTSSYGFPNHASNITISPRPGTQS